MIRCRCNSKRRAASAQFEANQMRIGSGTVENTVRYVSATQSGFGEPEVANYEEIDEAAFFPFIPPGQSVFSCDDDDWYLKPVNAFKVETR